MSFFDLTSPTYSYLNKYAILASGALTVTGEILVNAGPDLNTGFWYGSSVSGPGTLTTGTPPAAYKSNNSGTALSELGDLITNISAFTAGLSSSQDIGSGTITTFLPSINYYGTGIAYTGATLTFDAGSDPDAQFFITSSSAITFTGTTFVLANGAKACNIFWLAPTSTVGAFTATDSSVQGIIITGADFTTTSDAAGDIDFNGHIFSQGAATFTRSGAGGLTITADTCGPVVCYAKGSLILTKQGFVPIENIREGDEVVTKGKIYNDKLIKNDAKLKIEPVVWISKFKVKYLDSKSRPICIKKDTFGKNKPFQDLYVSPGHRLLLNGKMVLASKMINGITIFQDKECDKVEYYHLECEHHSAIFANGILAESYLDIDNNRVVFENSNKLRR